MESTLTDLAAPVIQVLRERRTISQSSLSQQEPDHRKVLEAIESARWAPNHHLTEPWRFYLLDPERIERLGELWAEVLERRGSSPGKVAAKRREWGQSRGIVILTCRSSLEADEKTRREDYAACCCAAQNFMLHLWACGLGSKWSTAAVDVHEGFWPLLGHDERLEGAEVVGVLFYGLPERIPEGRRSKSAEDITVNFRA